MRKIGGGGIDFIHSKNYIIEKNPNKSLNFSEKLNIEYFFKIYKKFLKNKRKRKDVNEFHKNLFENIQNLYLDIKNKEYKHGKYFEFKVIDNKTRIIHKASVRDRIVHRFIYEILYDFFDKKFIYDSYSSRVGKGLDKAVARYDIFFRKITKNYTKQAYVLKFDIKKCFTSIDSNILYKILEREIKDESTLSLCKEIINSHSSGLPLGNLTSQLFINIYLNELDFYIKHFLKIKYYIRYADDIICFFESKNKAEESMENIKIFCEKFLKLETHKEIIKTVYSGMDFLGFIHFKKYKILRKITQKRLLKNINLKNKHSYLGLLKKINGQKICDKICDKIRV